MSKPGPIVIVEDDYDDKEIFESIVRDLSFTNRIEWFTEVTSAYDYLHETKENVFLILSDLNMPGKNGLQFKQLIDQTPGLRMRCIPFIFFSTNAIKTEVLQAYEQVPVQGFFKKGTNYSQMKEMVEVILKYWTYCKHPNGM